MIDRHNNFEYFYFGVDQLLLCILLCYVYYFVMGMEEHVAREH